MTSQSAGHLDRCQRFRALHARPGIFVVPNPWDAGSARILAGLGFEALATTSAGLAFHHGVRDGARIITRDMLLANARDICAATDLPVTADLENGLADDPAEAAETMRLASGVGLAGGSLEDTTGVPSQPIYDFALAVERVTAAVEVVRALPVPFVLTARADGLINGRPDLDDVIKRLVAFEKAGADVLYAPGLKTLDQIKAVTAAVTKPVNHVMGSWNPDLTLEQLQEAGVRRVSVGGALARTALGAFIRAARTIREQGRFDYVKDAASVAELQALYAAGKRQA
jgi:2-methylisocitrate lyase-like PEP mutase family enzyme